MEMVEYKFTLSCICYKGAIYLIHCNTDDPHSGFNPQGKISPLEIYP